MYKDVSHTSKQPVQLHKAIILTVGFQDKTFEYTSPPLLINPTDFASTVLLQSHSFHMLAGPSEIIKDIKELLELRQSAHIDGKPLIIWEPRPSCCTPKNFALVQEAAQLVDVFSPNHVELASMFIENPGEVDSPLITAYADIFLELGIGTDDQGCIVVRSGKQGCFIASQKKSFWCPAYYEEQGESHNGRVIDPTGAGNAFLGAFAVGFLQKNSLHEAACYGAVGASFALEQIGIPECSSDQDAVELWNGDKVFDRLKSYQSRF